VNDDHARADARPGDVNLRAHAQMEEYRAIARRVAADHPAKVLDWGSGHGQMSDLLTRHGLDVTSFEYRPGATDGVEPMERYPHLSVRVSADPRRLPYADGSFDAVLSCGVLEHVEDPDASLDELRRVLTPNGSIYVYKLPNRTSYLEWVARRAGMYYHGAFEHDRLYDRRSAADLLRRHGYRVLEVRRANMLPLTLTSDLANRLTRPLWALNRILSAVPGLNRLATNVELVARVDPAPAVATPAAHA
jgi:2-polyprenyl-3-methyl-5-hydroxy-6-metoxy-1,4-benzoquinol methylase